MARSTPDLMPCASTGEKGLERRTREKNYTLEEVTWVGLVVASLLLLPCMLQHPGSNLLIMNFGIADADGVSRLWKGWHARGTKSGMTKDHCSVCEFVAGHVELRAVSARLI